FWPLFFQGFRQLHRGEHPEATSHLRIVPCARCSVPRAVIRREQEDLLAAQEKAESRLRQTGYVCRENWQAPRSSLHKALQAFMVSNNNLYRPCQSTFWASNSYLSQPAPTAISVRRAASRILVPR